MTTCIPETNATDFAKRIAKELVDFELRMLDKTSDESQKNLTNIMTLNIRGLSRIMNAFGISWAMMSQLVEQNIPIHPQLSKYLKGLCKEDEDVEDLLSQDFVKTEKIIKLKCLRNHSKAMEWLCAVDGIMFKHGGPNLDWRKYVTNLRFGLTGGKGAYDDEPNNDLKREHVQAVREIHSRIADKDTDNVDSTKVYRVMKRLALEECGIELPDVKSSPDDKPMSEMSESEIEDLKQVYLSMVGHEKFQKIAKLFRLENEKRKMDSSERKARKRKRVEENVCSAEPQIVNAEESDDEDDMEDEPVRMDEENKSVE